MHRLATALLITVLALASSGVGRASIVAPRAPAPPTFSGQLLVALDEIRDPRFFHTVIYMVRHDRDGAMGLVVNRPLGEIPAAELLARIGVHDERARGTIRVHYGGPVEAGRGFVLHTADYMVAGSQLVADGIALTVAHEMLESIARGTGPRRSVFALGYAGWAPGQLEAEIHRGAWATVPSDVELLFGADP